MNNHGSKPSKLDSLIKSSRCRYRNVRPHSLPAESHSFVGMARETAAMPPASKIVQETVWQKPLETGCDTHTHVRTCSRCLSHLYRCYSPCVSTFAVLFVRLSNPVIREFLPGVEMYTSRMVQSLREASCFQFVLVEQFLSSLSALKCIHVQVLAFPISRPQLHSTTTTACATAAWRKNLRWKHQVSQSR